MKIVQICLCGSYNPKMGYQDNILPKYYTKLGLECVTIACEDYIDKNKIVKDYKKEQMISKNYKLVRIRNRFKLGYKFNSIFRIYSGLYEALEREKPDIIFLHNFQFLSIGQVVKYCKRNKNIKVYADSHTDYINSATNWVSKNILHKLIWKRCTKKIEPYVIKFWGVTEQRCEFLENIYKVPESKIELLVMGADTDKIDFNNSNTIRNNIRKSLGIEQNDFLIISGGKIDKRKNIHLLIKAFNKIDNNKIKLVIFGKINSDMKDEMSKLLINRNIKYIDWIEADKVYDYFISADLGCFPGTHSVLWEQAVGSGLPCIFKRWYGMEHVDVGGNCFFLDKDSEDEIAKLINRVIRRDIYITMKEKALNKGIEKFSYFNIAKRSIEIE